MFEKWANAGRQRIREALGEQLARFQAVFLGGAGDSAWEPTIEEMITLSDSFHLCVAVPHKWASEMKHKCSCAHFTKETYCKHAVLLARVPSSASPGCDEYLRWRVLALASPYVGESLHLRAPAVVRQAT